MLLHDSPLELKSLNDETGEFEGMAAVYGNVDTQGDRIEAGAFAADDGIEVPILWDHKSDPIGVGKLTNTVDGVLIKGRLLLDTEAGREAYARLKAGAAKGLSVGFKLLNAVAGSVRRILAGSIKEVSLTAFPANPAALVTAYKSEPNPYAALLPYL
jgi:HK97 family phage prohead protease